VYYSTNLLLLSFYTQSLFLDITLVLLHLTSWHAHSWFYTDSLVTVIIIASCWFILYPYSVIWGQLGLCVLNRWKHKVYGIYEDFLVWIILSTYQSHESVYWARTTGFITSVYLITWCFIFCSCVFVFTTRFSIHVFRFSFIDICVLFYARHLALVLSVVGLLLTTLDLYVQISELGVCGFSRLSIKDSWW